jgi:hypothetical protein
MQSSDFERFRNVMAGMGEMYGKELSPPLLDAYWLSLRSWSLADFQDAAAHLMGSGQFMPKPADFNALRKAGRPTPSEAWLTATHSLQWGLHGHTVRDGCDPLIAKAIHAIGGPTVIAMTPTDKLPFVERRFCEVYESLQDSNDTREAVPQIASENRKLLASALGGVIGRVA